MNTHKDNLPPGGITTRYRHDHQTGAEFQASMTAIRMSEAEFSRLTGVRYRTLKKWIEVEGPPYWATMFLHMIATTPTARAEAHLRADRDLMTEEEYRSLEGAS
jgi:hypothetical protein